MSKDDNTQIDSAAKAAAAPPVGAQQEAPEAAVSNEDALLDQVTPRKLYDALQGALSETARLAPSNDVRSALIAVKKELRRRVIGA